MSTIDDIFLGLGANLGDRCAHLDNAIRGIAGIGGLTILGRSSVYETDPVTPGYDDVSPPFFNMVLRVRFVGTLSGLFDELSVIEEALGRIRRRRNEPRAIDIDILFAGDALVDDERLTIPHPRAAERRFVLTPMSEIAPGFLHPRLKKTVAELLAALDDHYAARIVSC